MRHLEKYVALNKRLKRLLWCLCKAFKKYYYDAHFCSGILSNFAKKQNSNSWTSNEKIVCSQLTLQMEILEKQEQPHFENMQTIYIPHPAPPTSGLSSKLLPQNTWTCPAWQLTGADFPWLARQHLAIVSASAAFVSPSEKEGQHEQELHRHTGRSVTDRYTSQWFH